MADFALRLSRVEKKLAWMMTNMRMRAMISSGLRTANGDPVPTTTFEGTMEELYVLSKRHPTVTQADAEPPPEASDAN